MYDIFHLIFFFFNDTATTEIYTLSLHDALPIFECLLGGRREQPGRRPGVQLFECPGEPVAGRRLRRPEAKRLQVDRKSTRLNSSHLVISYAVFCLKKKHIISY